MSKQRSLPTPAKPVPCGLRDGRSWRAFGIPKCCFQRQRRTCQPAGTSRTLKTCFGAAETLIELKRPDESRPLARQRHRAVHQKKKQTDEARFSDVHKSAGIVASEQQNPSERTDKSSSSEQDKSAFELESSCAGKQLAAFAELEQSLAAKTAVRLPAKDARAGRGDAPAGTLTTA